MCTKLHNSLQCIIPPYIAEQISKKKQARGPETADSDLLAAERIRKQRQAAPPAVTTRAAINEKMSIKIFGAGLLPILPGDLLWQTGDQVNNITDQSVKDVIQGSESTWAFYKSVFKRNSLDNKGMTQVHSVHFRENPTKPFGNAFWNGSQMIYGDGDGIFYSSFTSDIDIIAHELTHGVINFESNLAYKNQSGALNESFADVFGILIKQWATKTAARKSKWLIGENILMGDKYALRSLKAPGTAFLNHPDLKDDPQPAVMSDYIKMEGDDGGVHFNSGIPNHAFYVTAFEMGGNAWEKAGRIWYAALTDKKALKKNASFADARKVTLQKAAALFGEKTKEVKAVTKGWNEAGVE
jgi:Zn-dependent metalloprotease